MKKFITASTMQILSLSLLTLFLSGCAEQAKAPVIDDENNQMTISEQADETDQSAETVKEPVAEQDVDQLAPPKAGDKVAIIDTDYGAIKVKLFSDLTPEMAKNFEELANQGNYNGVPFHRVMKDFMIQTGDFTNKNGTGGYSYKGPGTTLEDEITPALKHLYGTVSMANRGPDTNGSQFFIVTNEKGTPFLDGGYTVFGQVYEGMDVAEKIEALQMPGTEQPSEVVNMTKVEVIPFE